MSDFHTTRTVVARRAHVCVEAGCTKEIRSGDAYVRETGRFDGQFYSIKVCVRCTRLRTKVWRRYGKHYDYDEGPQYGELLEWARRARR